MGSSRPIIATFALATLLLPSAVAGPQLSGNSKTWQDTDTGLDTGLEEKPKSSYPQPKSSDPQPDRVEFSLPDFDSDQSLTERVRFLRGDADGDTQVTISDAVVVLQHLFAGMPLSENQPCLDASDVNDDGRIDISDAIALLDHLFSGGSAPAQPYPEPGFDPGLADDHLTEACSLPSTDSLDSSSSTCACDWEMGLHTTYERENTKDQQVGFKTQVFRDPWDTWNRLNTVSYYGTRYERAHYMDAWGNWTYHYGRLEQTKYSGQGYGPPEAKRDIPRPELPLAIENYTQAITELQLVNTSGCTEETCIWPAGESRVNATMWFKAGGKNQWALFDQDEFYATAAAELIWRGGVSLSGNGSKAVSVSSDPSEGMTFSIPAFTQSVPIRILPPEQYNRVVVYPYRDFSTLNDTGTRYGLKLDVKTALDMELVPAWGSAGVAHTYARAEPRIQADVSGGCENCGIKAYLRDRMATVEIMRCGVVELQCYRAGFNAWDEQETPMNEIRSSTVPWKRVDCQTSEMPDSLAPHVSPQAQLSPKLETTQAELATQLGVEPAVRSDSVVILDPLVGDLLDGLGGSPAPCFAGSLTQWALLSSPVQETWWESCTDLETHIIRPNAEDSGVLLPLGVQIAR